MTQGKIWITQTTRQIAFLSGLTISTITTNALLGISYKNIIIFLTSAIFYIILSNINILNYSSNRDSIQNGDFAFASLTFLIAAIFFIKNIFLIYLIVFFILILFKALIKLLISPENIEIILLGLLINSLAIFLFIFIYQIKGESIIYKIESISRGYINILNPSFSLIITAFVSSIIFYILFFVNRHVITMHTLGKDYFSFFNISYLFFSMIIYFFKVLFFSISFFFAGIFTLMGSSLLYNIKSEYEKIPVYLLIIFYSQVMLLAVSFISPLYVAIFSFVMSYLIYFSFNFKDLKLLKLSRGKTIQDAGSQQFKF